MFWIFALLVGGGVYTTVNRIASPVGIAAIGGSIVLVYAALGVEWLDNQTGISNLLIGSWRLLSGVHDPNQIIVDCHGQGKGTSDFFAFALVMIAYVALIVVALATAVIGLAALIGIPLGALTTGGGAIYSLIAREKSALLIGSGVLTVGLGCMVFAGILMRIMHAFSGWLC